MRSFLWHLKLTTVLNLAKAGLCLYTYQLVTLLQ